MPRPREIALLVRARDFGALRVLLADQADDLEGPLDLPATTIRATATLDDGALTAAAAEMLRRGRLRDHQKRLRARRDLAAAGVARLVSGAIWSGNGQVHLDPAVLLGPVLADLGCRYLALHVVDAVVHVERRRLVGLGSLARALPGLTASVDAERLRFRWREGRGGLDFRSVNISRGDRDRIQHVVLAPSVPVTVAEHPSVPAPPPPLPAAMTTRGPSQRTGSESGLRSWLGDVIAELHSHL